LVPSEAPPSVVYGHDSTPQQQEVSLDDKQVGTPYFENGIPKNKLRQLKYLAKRVSDKIPLAMQPLKGSARFTRPEYRTRLVSLANEATAMSNSKTINVQVDTISDAITKLGGVSRASAESDGIDPAAFKRNRLFPAKDGRTFDELAEVLNEHGFTSRTGGKLGANDVLDLVDGEVNNGERHFSTQSDMLTETDQGLALSDLVREYGTERVQTAISRAIKGSRLGDRQAEIVNEAMDVIETGRIEQAGGIEARHAERDARREARIAKRKQRADIANSDLGLPAWVNDDAAQAESEYTETVEAALDQAINHAAIADPVAAEVLLDQYEANKITMASLVDQLGALKYDNQQKLADMENTQPVTEGAHSDSSTQRIEQGQEDTQPAMGTIRSGSTTSDQQHEAVSEIEPASDVAPQVSVTTDTVHKEEITPQAEIASEPVTPATEATVEQETQQASTEVASATKDKHSSIQPEPEQNTEQQTKTADAPTPLEKKLFSREGVTPKGRRHNKGMPLKQAEMAVKSWLRQYNGGAMVNAKVVKTQAEAEQILGTSLDSYKVNAFYNEVDATVVVVADNIANTKELRQKLRHEILVHHGLRAVVGNAEYNSILKMVYSGLDSRFLKPLIAEVEKSYSRSNLNNFVEEVLAHAAESDRNQVQKWRDRIIAKIAQALRKVGLLTPSDITQAELNNIVQTLTDRMKSINEWDPNTPPPSGNDTTGHLSRTKFSRTANNDSTSAFQSAVDQARAKLSSKMNGPIADVSDAGFDIPTDNLKSTIARKLADKFQVLKELQKNISKSGGNINEDNDAYLAEELFHGKAENDLRIMKDSFVKPLADKMAKHDISQAQLDEYLIARHAQERNDYIASINPKFPDGGSGMKNADAQAKLDEIRNSGKQQKYDELAHIVDVMITKQRDVLRDSGLESDEMLDTWQSHYKHYVPLKGIAKDESSLPRSGKGFSVGGKETKDEMGRQSMAESPSGHVILDLTEKLVRARKNEVGNTFLKMVSDNPSDDYWQVFTASKPDTAPQIVERKNPLTGEKEKIVEDRPVPMAMLSDYYFQTKKDGKIYYIKLYDKRLMKAMKNMGPDTSNGIIRFMAGFNRILASVNTSYNPEFVVGNFLRDIQTTVLNLSAEQSRDDGKIKGEAIVKQTIKDIRKAVPAIYASLRNKTSKSPETQEWQRHFEEFMEVGGKTGWFDMKDVDGQAKELDRMVAMANGSITGKAYKAFENVTGFVENINGSIENAVRLSAYVNARKAGISKKKAASLAKNMTVNFNRRGEVGTTLNAMYMFANASIQGSANFIRTMGDLNGDGKLKWQNLNNAQKIAIGVVAGSFALAFANRGVAGDDEDGVNWFDKIPSYVKERNFIIMKSLLGGEADGSYWSIPMPYGYNLFSIAGTGIESAINSDNSTPMQTAGDMALATLGSFSPIGMSDSDTISGTVLKNALPTIGKPFLEVALNENFFGAQIYQENMPFGTKMPHSSMAKRSTGEGYKEIAKWLNSTTGGSNFRSGFIDLPPETMKYIVGYFGGGALRFAMDKGPNIALKAAGADIEDSKVAFLSRISGRVMPYQDQSTFYDRRDELMQIKDEAKAVRGVERKEFMTDHGYKLRLLPLLKSTEQQLKALRKRRNAVYGLDMPAKQKDLRLKSIERQMKVVIDRFNLRYTQLKGK
ncbi:LPD38 domain-containing protein, partial [Photobacterium phosphoreum]|uniref:LPD38 domain-containing protein n=1 Tax=Photobacterium phosphoreum TaxID=659 RepID=UPI001E38BA4E